MAKEITHKDNITSNKLSNKVTHEDNIVSNKLSNKITHKDNTKGNINEIELLLFRDTNSSIICFIIRLSESAFGIVKMRNTSFKSSNAESKDWNCFLEVCFSSVTG